MKHFLVGVQFTLVITVLVLSYFFLVPFYWQSFTGFDRYAALGRADPDSPTEGAGHNKSHEPVQTQHPISDDEYLLQKPIWEKPPVGSEMPPLEKFKLTNMTVAARAENNVILVTFANHAFLDFVLTWVRHLTEMNVFNILVGAMDMDILEALYQEGVPVFDMGSKMNPVDVGWGTATFHKMGREKVMLVNEFLSMGYALVMCDTDMVWIQNPLPYFERFPAADVLVSSDEVASSVNDDGLEIWDRAHGAYNIGIFLWRPTDVAKRFAREWKEQLLADDRIWDQNGFNELMRKHMGPSVEGDSRLFYAYDGNLKLGILPVSIFCSGHTYFVQVLYEKLGLNPYAVHTTFQFGGTPGKRHRLREAKLFYDKHEYYDTPGGFLSYRSVIPEDLLTHGPHSIENHFKLVNFQMKQIRDALAIASVLNRTLIMPKLWCRLDRLWFGHPGILPGSKTSQPFLCPMDHVFEVNTMLENLDESNFGSAINFREYSFLDNPRLPKLVKSSKIYVRSCKKGSEGCGEEAEGNFKLPKNSTENEILTALMKYKDVKILKFSSLSGIFGGFEDKVRESKFRARVKRYTGIWCCAQNLQRGHIYYDIYWDEKPNWKPIPPATIEDDHHPF